MRCGSIAVPHREDFLGAGRFDLLTEATMIELQQRIMAFVGRAADTVSWALPDRRSCRSMVAAERRLRMSGRGIAAVAPVNYAYRPLHREVSIA